MYQFLTWQVESVKYLGYTIMLVVLISLLILLVYTAYYHILTQDMFNFAYVINLKCNNSILHGGGMERCNMDISK